MRAAGALGGKAAGSGAGGCMFFLGPDDPRAAAAAARGARHAAAAGALGDGRRRSVLSADGARRAAVAARRVGRSRARSPRRLAERAARGHGRPAAGSRAEGAALGGRRVSVPTTASPLEFDPWSPTEHRCSRCGRRLRGRAARSVPGPASSTSGSPSGRRRSPTLAALAGQRGGGATRPRHSHRVRRHAISSFPTATTCSDPSRLFFSTYLESIWLTNYLAAATLLREGRSARRVGRRRREHRRRRSRQPDRRVRRGLLQPADVAQRRARGDRRLVRGRGAGRAGARGTDRHPRASGCAGSARTGCGTRARTIISSRCAASCSALGWARHAGADLLDRSAARRSVWRLALRAPDASPRCPTSRFPPERIPASACRSPSRCISSCGRSGSPGWATRRPSCGRGSRELYRARRSAGRGRSTPTCTRRDVRAPVRAALASRPLLVGAARDGAVASRAVGRGARLRAARLAGRCAILREGSRYASLECGPYGGGHGHPDRLHLTLHADGRHWLADPGTGSYVSRDLFWYRSTLAHNAPRLDGVNPAGRGCLVRGVRRAGCVVVDPRRVRRADPHARRRSRLPARRRRAVRLRRAASLELAWHPAGDGRGGVGGKLDRRCAGRRIRERRRAARRIAATGRCAAGPVDGSETLDAAPAVRRRSAAGRGAGPSRRGRAIDVLRSPGCGRATRGSSPCSTTRTERVPMRSVAVRRPGDRGREHRRPAPTSICPPAKAGRSPEPEARCRLAGLRRRQTAARSRSSIPIAGRRRAPVAVHVGQAPRARRRARRLRCQRADRARLTRTSTGAAKRPTPGRKNSRRPRSSTGTATRSISASTW